MADPTKSDAVIKLLKQQAALAAFGSFAFQETDLARILNEAARICAASLGVKFCKICRYREAENDLLIEAGCGWNDHVIGIVVSKADDSSPQGRAFTTGEPVIIPNLQGSNGLRLPPFYAEHGIVSTVDVVIPGFRTRPYGVLEIDSTDGHEYDEYDIAFLTGFANVLAEAVATATRTKALQEALALKSLLAEELHHRVRNHFHVIQSMLQIYGADTPDGGAAMEGVGRQVGVFAAVYEQLLGTGLTATVDLSQYARSLCASLTRGAPDKSRVQMRYLLEPLLIKTDMAVSLGMVIAELVSNAHAHAFPQGTGTVTLSMKPDPGEASATMTIADDGVGFTENPSSLRHGVRLSRQLVDSIDGTCDVVSNGGGTTWTIRFPTPEVVPA